MDLFSELLNRLNFILEAKGEGKGLKIRSEFPQLAPTHKQASVIAKQTHPNVFSRYAKNSVLVIIDLILDTDFTEQFKSTDQDEIIKYWQTTADDEGVLYSKRIAAITIPDIDRVIKARGITGEGKLEDIVHGQIYNLYQGKDNAASEKRAMQAAEFASRPGTKSPNMAPITAESIRAAFAKRIELIKNTRAIASSASELSDAAQNTGDQGLAASINNIGDQALRASERTLVQLACYKIVADIYDILGEPEADIPEEALEQVTTFIPKIKTLASLKSLISQMQNEPGYEKIAIYLSSAIKPIKSQLNSMHTAAAATA